MADADVIAIGAAVPRSRAGPGSGSIERDRTGHFIDMVPSAQATHYKNHGHQGGHCTTGLSDADKKKSSYSGLPGTCVMFGENAVGRSNEFCATCDPSVRKSPIKRSGMPAAW